MTPIKKRVLAERKAVTAVAAMYQQRLAKLNAELQRKLNPHRKRMVNLREEAQDVVREVIDGLALPKRPRPEIVAPQKPALFDSRRSYFEQLAVYHKVSPPPPSKKRSRPN